MTTLDESAVIAHWEPPIVARGADIQKKLLTRWTHTLKAFGIHRLVLVDVDNLSPFINDAELAWEVAVDLAAALDLCAGLSPVFVEEGGPGLSHFQHPDQAVYVFGSDFSGLSESSVGIPTANPLHADVACGVILADRGAKRWH